MDLSTDQHRVLGSPRRPVDRFLALSLILLVVAGCATTDLPPISQQGAGFQPLPDEVAMWSEARQEEEKLLDSVDVYEDPLLEEYLEDVVVGLQPPGMAANPQLRYRVKVIEDPTLNAFAYPHGSLYVHTGLLARMENESQLATVLGHEMTHVEHRHMIRYRRSLRNKQIAWSAVAVAAAVIAAGEEADAWEDGDWGRAARVGVLSDVLVGLGLQLAVLASVNGYGRDLELEADHGAFRKLQASGYDIAQAPRVYELLRDDHGDASGMEVFFFGSHPKLDRRIENARHWIAQNPGASEASEGADSEPRVRRQTTFERRLRPVVRDDARLSLELGRLELAEHQLMRAFEGMPEDPEVHYLFARLYLAQADEDPERFDSLRVSAYNALRESIRLDPDRPDPHLRLGLLAYDDADFETACVQFRQYVEIAQEADDAGRIRDYVLELERDGQCPG
ncbi:MAG: M48 family metalloprotease [Thermoanaerobaculia bacterium]|nr:M48 family metalloprotease [Thermoanaerobaculia bacterium]